MKGRQLTLEEVLRLDDGTKVWVESLYVDKQYESGVYSYNDKLKELTNKNGTGYYFDYLGEYYSLEDVGIDIYKIEDMAQEICNLRGLDLTEDNIGKIMKEFVDKE